MNIHGSRLALRSRIPVRRFSRWWLALALACAGGGMFPAAPPACGRTHVVFPTAASRDDNDSPASRHRTLAAAAAVAQDGDTIVLQPGRHVVVGTVILAQRDLRLTGHRAALVPAGTATPDAPNVAPGLVIRGDRVTIDGLEMDGGVRAFDGGGSFDALITVTARGVTVRDCYLHGTNGIGVKVLADDALIRGCLFERTWIGVFGEDHGAVRPVRTQVLENRFLDGWGDSLTDKALSGAVKLKSNGAAWDAGHQVLRNSIRRYGEMGIELWGCIDGCEVSDNTIYGTVFGISIGGASGARVVGNTVRGATFCGIELAGDASGALCLDNAIDGRDDTGPGALDAGYSLSAGFTDSEIRGGAVVEAQRAVNCVGVAGMTIRDVFIRTLSAGWCVTIQGSDRLRFAGCTFAPPADGQPVKKVFFYASDRATPPPRSGLRLENNAVFTPVSENFLLFYSTNGGRFDDTALLDNYVRSDFIGGGFISASPGVGGLGALTQTGNFPASRAGQSGFANAADGPVASARP